MIKEMLKELRECWIKFILCVMMLFRRHSKKYDSILLDVIDNKKNILKIEYDRVIERFVIKFKRKFTTGNDIIGTSNNLYVSSNFKKIAFTHGWYTIIDYRSNRPSLYVAYKFVKFVENEFNYKMTLFGNFKEKEINQDFNLSEFIN